MTPQQLPFCAFQHFPPLTSAKQQEEGITGCTRCCSSGTDGTQSDCSRQPHTLGICFLCRCPKPVFSGNSSSAKPTGSLQLHQVFHCYYSCADTTVEVRGEQKEQNSAQGLLLLPCSILLWHNTTRGHQRMEYIRTKVSRLKASTTTGILFCVNIRDSMFLPNA